MGAKRYVLIVVAAALVPGACVLAWQETWEAASLGSYTPVGMDYTGTFVHGDGGVWYVGDTISDFPECGPTPHRAEILMYQGSQALKLTSEFSGSECADNIWVAVADYGPGHNSGYSIPLTPETRIAFKETGELLYPGPHGWGRNCLTPPCFDNVSILLTDNRGNILAYVLQRYPGTTPNVSEDLYGDVYHEVFLDAEAGSYQRNLYNDFSTIPNFRGFGAAIEVVEFKVDEHGWAILDDLRITDSPASSPQASFVCLQEMPMVGGLLEFDASISDDPDGNVVLYEWDWGDGSTDSATDPCMTHVYACLPDVYTVTLTVTDNEGLADSTSMDLDLRLENGDILLCRSYQSFVPGEWTHAGIYNKGLNRVIEARPEGVDHYPLDDWSWLADRTWVRVFRVYTTQDVRDEAVTFATAQRGAEYDWWLLLGKQTGGDGPLASRWYCSELVWAGYYNATGGGIDLDSSQYGLSIAPSEIAESPSVYAVAEHLETRPNTIYTEPFGGSVFSPVDIVVTDPNGRVLSKAVNEIPGALYEEGDIDADGEPDDVFFILEPKEGSYTIEVIPEPGADPNDTYTLKLILGSHLVTMATDVAIKDIPAGGYQVDVPLPVASVYRFWSATLGHHFYTISETEKDKLSTLYPDVWEFEGTAFYAFPEGSQPAEASPVYRFWSDALGGHFYTIQEDEKDKLIDEYPDVWTFEGEAFYAYPGGSQVEGTKPIYRFWSADLSGHFYTIDEGEKDKLIEQYPHVWTYEGVAWHAYE